MSEETTSTQERKPMDMQEAVDSILIPKDAPAQPEDDKVTAAEAASTTSTENELTEDEATDEAVDAPEEEEEVVEEDDDSEEDADDSEEPEADADPEDTEESEEDEDSEVVYQTAEGDEVTLDELKRGYLRQSDYTKKTQEVAEGRKSLEAQYQTFEQNNQAVAANLELALNVIEPQLVEFAQTDWEQLVTTDAYEYAERKALFEQAQSRYAQVQQAAQKTVEFGKQQQAQAQAQYLAAEREKLAMALPDMASPTAGRKLATAIKEYALTSGLSEQEASNITDHRMIVMLNKARMYDELNESGVSAAKKKLTKGPKKLVQAGKPQTKQAKSAATQKAMRAKLAKTGDVDDAVNWLLGG